MDVFVPYVVSVHPEEIKQVKKGNQFVKKEVILQWKKTQNFVGKQPEVVYLNNFFVG
jgi:hypothetical protein